MGTAKKIIGLIALLYCVLFQNAQAQSCPQITVNLYTQAKVDSFPINYPACTQLPQGLIISGSDITNLDSLAQITRISGLLDIKYNSKLKSLSGLDNLDTVYGGLSIRQNDSLENLQGLGELKYISGDLDVMTNPSIKDFSGLDKLNWLANLRVVFNPSLDSLKGLESIATVGPGNNGIIQITANQALKSVKGLENIDVGTIQIWQNNSLKTLDGFQNNVDVYNLAIVGNDSLLDIKGLENYKTFGGNLHITGNQSLKNLHELDGLTFIGGSLSIAFCNSMNDLSGLDSLIHTGTFEIHSNPRFKNLDHLQRLVTVAGQLKITSNDSLLNLNGLEGVKSVSGDLRISENRSLWTLSGLSSLNFIGNKLRLESDSSLTDISSLIKLKRIENEIIIKKNASLTSLTGLDSVDASFLSKVAIFDSPKLSICGVQSICDYLSSGKIAYIYGNANGCNDTVEVKSACASISLIEMKDDLGFAVYPNPSVENFVIVRPGSSVQAPFSVTIVDALGKVVNSINSNSHESLYLKTHKCRKGIHLIKLSDSNGQTFVQKIFIN